MVRSSEATSSSLGVAAASFPPSAGLIGNHAVPACGDRLRATIDVAESDPAGWVLPVLGVTGRVLPRRPPGGP
jgi:hypothetical protein